MNKLMSADIPRIIRSKILYAALLLTVFLGAASVLVVFTETDDKAAIFPIASNNLVMFLSMMLPIFSGGFSIMLIAGEFSSGVIRNKFIMGHSRTSILFSWCALYSVTTAVTFLLYIGTFFLTLNVIGAEMPSDMGTVFLNIGVIFLFAMKFQMFSLLMVCIYPDAKMAVICYLLNNITMVPLMLLSMYDEDSAAIKFLSRIFIFGYTTGDYTFLTKPDKPWLTAVCIVMLSVVYMILANACFKRKDLK